MIVLRKKKKKINKILKFLESKMHNIDFCDKVSHVTAYTSK